VAAARAEEDQSTKAPDFSIEPPRAGTPPLINTSIRRAAVAVAPERENLAREIFAL
jgi:hypothetical protein